MKPFKTFAILLLSFSLLLLNAKQASAQQLVPDSIANKQVTLQLKGKHLAFVWGLMQDKGTTEATNLRIQIRKQAPGTAFDTAHIFTITVSYQMVAKVYYTTGSQQERIAADDNAEMKAALIPQLSVPQYLDLLGVIQSIGSVNKQQTELLRSQGTKEIMETIL